TLSITSAYGIVVFSIYSRRRHTRSKRDWSSDVCSSDLMDQQKSVNHRPGNQRRADSLSQCQTFIHKSALRAISSIGLQLHLLPEIGRASCRERVSDSAIEVAIIA